MECGALKRVIYSTGVEKVVCQEEADYAVLL